jgi:hypothetical protein
MNSAREKTPALAPWGRWDRLGMWAILAGSVVYALVVLVSGIAHLVHQLASRTWTGSLIVEDELPASADAGTATLISGTYETAAVTLGDLSGGAFGLLTTSLVFSVLTAATVAVSFVYLSWRLLRAKPFKKSLTVAFLTAGSALLLGTIISVGFDAIGRMIAITELVGDDVLGGFWPMAVQSDLAPIGFGLALLVVACAFEYGEKLTRETDGLV